jgi:hypothetical protein
MESAARETGQWHVERLELFGSSGWVLTHASYHCQCAALTTNCMFCPYPGPVLHYKTLILYTDCLRYSTSLVILIITLHHCRSNHLEKN